MIVLDKLSSAAVEQILLRAVKRLQVEVLESELDLVEDEKNTR